MPIDTEIQLKPAMESKFEQEWDRRDRYSERGKKVSRSDFRSGFIAALVATGERNAFVRPREVGL